MAIASRSRSHWVHVERARGLAVLVFLEEDSTLDYIHRQCNSCKSTEAKIIPGIGSLVTAASRAATAKKLETFMATKEQTVTIDGLGERQTRGDRSIERAKKRLASSERENSSRNEGGAVGGGIQEEEKHRQSFVEPTNIPIRSAWPDPHHTRLQTQHLSSPCSITSKHPPSGPAACIS
jgi:hypothetical protein